MWVLRTTLDGSEFEGEVIGGDRCDEVSGTWILLRRLQCERTRARSSSFMDGWSMLSF